MSEVAEVWLTEVVSVVGEELESCSTVVCTAEASALAAGLTEQFLCVDCCGGFCHTFNVV